MTEKEALEYIEKKQLYKGIRKMDGLEQLCQRLSNPQKAIPIIGIATTSGRRSVAVYMEAVLSRSGYRVGRYAKGAVSDVREHVRVKERPMTKHGLCTCLEQIQEAIDGLLGDGLPTPSPAAMETAIAYLYFIEKDCEVVLWETEDEIGNIQLQSRIDESLLKKVRYGLEKQSFTYGKWERLEISIGGNQEIENAALAVEALACLERSGFAIKESTLRKGLLEATCEDCMHVMGKKPWFLVQVIENAESAQVLGETLEQYFHGKRKIFIMGSLRDMEYDRIMSRIARLAEYIITVTVRDDVEGMHAYELAKEVQQYHHGVTAVDSPEEAIELAYLLADKETVVVALGATAGLGSLIKCVKQRNNKQKKS